MVKKKRKERSGSLLTWPSVSLSCACVHLLPSLLVAPFRAVRCDEWGSSVSSVHVARPPPPGENGFSGLAPSAVAETPYCVWSVDCKPETLRLCPRPRSPFSVWAECLSPSHLLWEALGLRRSVSGQPQPLHTCARGGPCRGRVVGARMSGGGARERGKESVAEGVQCVDETRGIDVPSWQNG